MLKLWFAPGTCARVALTALEEIGEEYDTGLIAFMAGEHRKSEFLRINPSGKVPALETEHGVLVQNGAILSWLADTYPASAILPCLDDSWQRASIMAEVLRCSSDLHPLVTRFVMPHNSSTSVDDAVRIREKASELLTMQLSPVADRLGNNEWVLGANWSILDAYIAWIWARITTSGFDRDSFPQLRDHYVRAMDRPSALAAREREVEAEKELSARGLLFRPPFDDVSDL